MGIAVIPAPSAGGKILKKLTLTGGSSWTVPTGVTDINVTLVGGGGGGGAAGPRLDRGFLKGGTGGTTTFTGATSASGGYGGNSMVSQANTTRNNYSDGNTGVNNGDGGDTGFCTFSSGIGTGAIPADHGSVGGLGQRITSTITTTPGSSINYSIGAGGSAGYAGISAIAPEVVYGGAGAPGKIDIEYWV